MVANAEMDGIRLHFVPLVAQHGKMQMVHAVNVLRVCHWLEVPALISTKQVKIVEKDTCSILKAGRA
jgi:hypothetical protein